jgi:hypothetical protein
MSYNLYGVIRNHLTSLMMGTYTVSGARVMQVGRFKRLAQDKTVETTPANEVERSFQINFTNTEELEPWNSFNIEALQKIDFDVVVGYQYTRGGMFPDDTAEGLSSMQGNGDDDSVNDRAFTDSTEIIKLFSYHANFGIIQASPLVDIFSIQPLNNNTLTYFKDRAVMVIKMQLFLKISTSSDYSGF